jgi:hypothetical protein
MTDHHHRFFKDEDFEFVFLTVLGKTYHQAADIGECLAIAARIKDGDAESAFIAFHDMAERVLATADRSAAAGHRVSAREAYLRAAAYFAGATYFTDASHDPGRLLPTWRAHRAAWDEAASRFDPPAERVTIPYEGTTLPGYFFKADTGGARRPLVILNNGSDGSVLDMWTWGGAAAIARGYHALAFDGPGQQAALFEQGLYFRPDWEQVITPVVDYALTRPDVDPDKIALLGVSQGGYWVPRAVAFEHRIAAAIADPGVWDMSTVWVGKLPHAMQEMLVQGKKTEFDRWMHTTEFFARGMKPMLRFRMRPFGMTSEFDVMSAARQYTMAGIAERITCPMLITDPEHETFWPGQARQLFEALRCPKTLVPFTVAEGADLHCEPKAAGLREQRIFDWLDQVLHAGR